MAAKICDTCGTPLGNRNKGTRCQSCLRVCRCGRPKDYRATLCQSCASHEKAIEQWRNPESRKRIYDGIISAAKAKRSSFEDLGTLKWQARSDGRHYNWYWPEGADEKATIYRYQWVWIMANGPIPEGYVIHHIDGDLTNDALDNLELMQRNEHARLHGKILKSNRPWWICQWCGQRFQRLRRSDRGDPKYCSLDCYHQAQRYLTYPLRKTILS